MRIERLAVAILIAGSAIAASAEDLAFARPQVIPAPTNLTYEAAVAVQLDAACAFTVRCQDAVASKWAADHAERWFGVRPNVTADLTPPQGLVGSEAYALSASPGRIEIRATSLAGVRHAMSVLRQAALRNTSGGARSGFWLPALEVADAPKLAFRGLHVCWFPETPVSQVERLIRMAGYYRFNFVVLESWGTFRSERYPWWGWPDGKMTKAEIRRLRAIAADLGVTLVPQFNVFGHAALSRAKSGKHAVLDLHPEYQSLYEPDGWNWCLSNPETLKVVRDLVVEMHEAFGNPPFFHLGCDEAHAPGCPRCRAAQPYESLLERHLVDLNALLKSRGAQPMIWHDMLLDRNDSRWKPFYHHGNRYSAEMLERLPRDIVICDWYYGRNYGKESVPKNYSTLAHFSSLGFPTVTCPWNDPKSTASLGRYAAEHHLFGMLGTIWHHTYNEELPRTILSAVAAAAWGTPAASGGFATHWRQIGWDVGVSDYRECGYVSEQLPAVPNVEDSPGG